MLALDVRGGDQMTYTERDERLRLQDLALRSKVGHWATLDLMRPSEYCRPRDLVPMPWRESAKPSGLVHRTTVCAGSPKTPAQAEYRSDYALRLELGDRAYAVLTGKRIRRSPNGRAAVARPRPNAEAARLDAEAARAERLRTFTKELQTAGTIVLGEWS